MSWRLIYESFGMYLAFAIGCLVFFQSNRFLRLIFLQVALAVPFYFLTHFVIYYQRSRGMELNNLWVHNLYTVLETLLLALAGLSFLRKRSEKLTLLLLYLVCLSVAWIEYLNIPVTEWYTYTFYSEIVLVVLLYSYILYKLIHQHPGEWRYKPEFWIILGLLFYFAGDSPYIMLINYFNEKYLELNSLLYNVINNFLANARYLLYALGFWLCMIAKEKEQVI